MKGISLPWWEPGQGRSSSWGGSNERWCWFRLLGRLGGFASVGLTSISDAIPSAYLLNSSGCLWVRHCCGMHFRWHLLVLGIFHNIEESWSDLLTEPNRRHFQTKYLMKVGWVRVKFPLFYIQIETVTGQQQQSQSLKELSTLRTERTCKLHTERPWV